MSSDSVVAAALEDVERAFQHLEFAIKLLCYCELDLIDREKFDGSVVLRLKEGELGFESNMFESLEAIVTPAQANVGVAFGVSAIVLDAAFQIARFQPDPQSSSDANVLRTIVYMIRCAFAHNPAAPCWEVREKYAKTVSLSLDDATISLDFPRLHRQSFDYEHIGGFANWFRMKRTATAIIRTLA